MTNPIILTLDIHAWDSRNNDGFTNTTCSDGTIYSYKWAGGTDGAGNVVEHLRAGVADIYIHTVADRRFVMIDAKVSDGTTQFQISVTDTWKAYIHDIGSVNEDDYFKVQFRDDIPGHNSRTFWCDPRIKNTD